jgi:hypothetical protein
MADIPKFRLYGEADPKINQAIQPKLPLRRWSELSEEEKQTALREFVNKGWLEKYSHEIMRTIEQLNRDYLRQCPGKHAIKPERDQYGRGNEYQLLDAAVDDFQDIFLKEKSDELVLRMLSIYAAHYIDRTAYNQATKADNEPDREKYVATAFAKFDRLTNCLNRIFEQFAVDQLVTRNGFVPRQDQKINEELYVPTLQVLADPKWASVSADLAGMFEDHRSKNYAEAITKAHSSVQRFLQVLVGEEGKSGKGELSKLLQRAREKDLISTNRFVEPVMAAMIGFIPAERATNSTAKPALKEATSSDALLMMNVVMVLIQHCLQNLK